MFAFDDVDTPMGSAAPKASKQELEALRSAWRRRLENFYSHYDCSITLRQLDQVVSRVVDNPAVWQALLAKYGPELDPPFDLPPRALVVGKATRQRQFLGSADARQFWVRRFVRYYAHYDPERRPEAIEAFVASVPLHCIESVWGLLVEKRGPEPQGDATKRIGGGDDDPLLSPTYRAVEEFEGRRIEVVRKRRMDVDVVKQVRTDNIERQKMKVNIAMLRAGVVGKDASWDAVSRLVDGADMKSLHDLLPKEAERGADVSPTRTQSPRGRTANIIDRRFWHALIGAYDSHLDPFQREDLIDAYEKGVTGGLRELLATLEAKEEEGLHSPLPAFAKLAALQGLRSGERGEYRLFHDLSPRQFWQMRLGQFYVAKDVAMSPEQLEQMVDLFLSTGCETMWTMLQGKHGPEPPELEAPLREHREYWASRCRLLLRQRAPHVDDAEVESMLDSCGRQWRAAFDTLVERYGGVVDVASACSSVAAPHGALPPTTAEQQRPCAEEERAMWFERMTAFLAFYNPPRSSRMHVNTILDRALDMHGGWAMAWGLLLAKYGPEPPRTRVDVAAAPALGPVDDHTQRAQRSADAEATASTQPLRHIPSVADAQRLLRHNREYWGRLIRDYLVEKHIVKSEIELEMALDKYLEHPEGYCALWDDLQRQYGHTRIGTVADVEFWQFMLQRYIDEKHIVARAAQALQGGDDARLEFQRLRRLHGPLALERGADSRMPVAPAVLEALRGDFLRHRAKRRAPGQLAPSVELRVPREYWLQKMEAYRRETCPTLSPQIVATLVEAGEVSGVSMEKLWVQLVQMCCTSSDVVSRRRTNPLSQQKIDL